MIAKTLPLVFALLSHLAFAVIITTSSSSNVITSTTSSSSGVITSDPCYKYTVYTTSTSRFGGDDSRCEPLACSGDGTWGWTGHCTKTVSTTTTVPCKNKDCPITGTSTSTIVSDCPNCWTCITDYARATSTSACGPEQTNSA